MMPVNQTIVPKWHNAISGMPINLRYIPIIVLSFFLQACNVELEGDAGLFGSNLEAPELKTLNDISIVAGETLEPIILQNVGGAKLTSCDATPALPEGMLIGIASNASHCVVSGTAPKQSNQRNYVFSAQNDSGHSSINVNVAVIAPLPALATIAEQEFVKGEAINSINIKNSGGDIKTCSADSLPEGLNVALAPSGDCILTGTPSLVTPLTEYRLSASNDSGISQISFHAQVIAPAPLLNANYSTQMVHGQLASELIISNNRPDLLTACDIKAGELPSGLSVKLASNSLACVVSGTPDSTGIYNVILAASTGSKESTTNLNFTITAQTEAKDTTAPSYQITSPIAQAYLTADQLLQINWVGTEANPSVVELEYSLDDGLNYTLITESPIADALSFDWDISNMPSSETVKIRLTAIDVANNASIIESPTFSLKNEHHAQESTIEISTFDVQYFFEDDGNKAGEGTDGLDQSISPVLMYSETSSAISLNYSYSDFHGINANGFYGQWLGTIKVSNAPATVYANVAGGWADMALYIDDQLVEQWDRDNKTIPLNLAVGEHTIRFDFHNHWHTTMVNVSFTEEPATTTEMIAQELAAEISSDTQLAYVGVYESADTYNEITVIIPDGDTPFALFLSSYDAVRWVIENPANREIAAILVSGYTPGSIIEQPIEAPVYYVSDLGYAYKEFDDISTKIETIVGRKPDITHGINSTTKIDLNGGQFEVSNFAASYFFEADGNTPSEGTDGSDDTIIPTLMHSETTEAISLSYIYSQFKFIDSYGFYGRWEGSITVTEAPKKVYANITGSHSDMALYVDGQLAEQWADSDKVIPLELTVGEHSVRFEYHNHWHTTDVNVSFTDELPKSILQVSSDVADLITDETELAYVGAYESGNTYNEIHVNVQENSKPLALVLSSLRAVRWVIHNPTNREITSIVVGSRSPESTVESTTGIPIFAVDDLKYAYEDFDEVSSQIETMVGRKPDRTIGKYSLKETLIP